ncbi:four helix bundle protein [Pleurocapsales cyanobacterium LEGE 10410]|nr:four helix bundle protein [Pleurocapsales cyanobacterium LEGE 10410]
MKKNIAYSRAYQFAIKIINAHRYLIEEKKEFVLSEQLLKSGTSIGATILEAIESISTAEKRANISFAYRNCILSKYWLSLLRDTGYIDLKSYNNIYQDLDEITQILLATLKTVKNS